MTQASDFAALYRDACELELRAFKPGNVSDHAAGHDMTSADFRRSAEASAPWVGAPGMPVGERIFRAIEATQQVVSCNTNLGIVLLAAPLLAAAERARISRQPLRTSLRELLATLGRDDADWVYRAIRLANPGGLGQSDQADVTDSPSVTLRDAMRIAADRDSIARQFINSFAEVFDFAIPRYHCALSQGTSEEWAAVQVFVSLLRRIPDSHIERKFGNRFTGMVAGRMARLERAFVMRGGPQNAVMELAAIDKELKAVRVNPGTTADLTVACLIAARLTRTESVVSASEGIEPASL